MTNDEFKQLKIGDRVIGRMSGQIFTLTGFDPTQQAWLAVRHVWVSRADEWIKVNAETGDSNRPSAGQAGVVSIDPG